VTYTASDIAGNTAKCHFQIIIVAKPCDDLRTPQNGAKTCDKWLDGGTFCTLHCNVGYDFALKPLEIYFCDASGNWNQGDKVPDCSSKTTYRNSMTCWGKISHSIRRNLIYKTKVIFSDHNAKETACAIREPIKRSSLFEFNQCIILIESS